MFFRFFLIFVLSVSACRPKQQVVRPPSSIVVVMDTVVFTTVDSLIVYRLDTIKETDTVRVKSPRAVMTVTRRLVRCDVKPDTIRVTKTITVKEALKCPPPPPRLPFFLWGVIVALIVSLILYRILR